MKNNKIQLLDISFDRRLINLLLIAKDIGYSYTYTRLLLTGKRKNKQASKKVRDSIIRHYMNLITFVK